METPTTRIPEPALYLSPPLDAPGEAFWSQANREVLWGWKRDAGRQSRLVYYSAKLGSDSSGIYAYQSFLFYKHRTDPAAECLRAAFEKAGEAVRPIIGPVALNVRRCSVTKFPIVTFQAGVATPADEDRVRRLQLRRPRRTMETPMLPPPCERIMAQELVPFDLYAGSGVSYEAGLPTLCDMHDAFCLDNHRDGTFTLGQDDALPFWLRDDPAQTVARFCALHVKALSAQPSRAQHVIGRLYHQGYVGHVLSDNMLSKVRVPFVRTRGSGVFNERHHAEFKTRTLVVVGVAADRREIIQQARSKRMRIVVVNPCRKVSPRVQHLNYVRDGDLFYKRTAEQFFVEFGRQLETTTGWHG